ncbi:hypothetical protein MHUMG1_10012 [Metarhizium humberi]|uniref:Uncharacterized protein n=1 Tax=Metarhizium humberi TaxID=2596975 RepID=A0A9P8M2B4_9HYPO|nr:hypothetical protein MHUMG1_10012 [Metarhizium humberi]
MFHPPADSGSSHCRFRPGSRHGIPAGAWQFHGLVSSTSPPNPAPANRPDSPGKLDMCPMRRQLLLAIDRTPCHDSWTDKVSALSRLYHGPAMDNSGGPQLHPVWPGPTTDRLCRINALREHAPDSRTKQQPDMGASRCLFGPIESISDFTRNIETATTCARAIWAVAAPVPPVFACSAQGPLRHPAPTPD